LGTLRFGMPVLHAFFATDTWLLPRGNGEMVDRVAQWWNVGL